MGVCMGELMATVAMIAEAIDAPFDPGLNCTSTLPFCSKAAHPDTGVLAEHWSLVKSLEGHLWEHCSACIKFGQSAQGCQGCKGTDTIFFINHNEVPKD